MNARNEKNAPRAQCGVRLGRRTRCSIRPFARFLVMVALGMMAGLPGTESRAGDPGELFTRACAPCHGKDGKAQTPAAKKLGVKNLSLSKLEAEEIVEQIREGKQRQQKTSKMPAFKEKLSAEEINSLVEVVKKFRNEQKSP